MTETPPRPDRGAPPHHRAVTVAYALATVALAWASLRAVWGGGRFDLVMAVGALLGVGAALVTLHPRGRVAGPVLLVAGYLVAALTLAIPGVPAGLDGWLRTVREAVVGPVTGWKDVVTLPTPLGDYGATLVPALALAVALAVLLVLWSFAVDVRWLEHQAR